MTIEVIGAGFGRTGTMSLKVALEELGFEPCYHMIELFAHPGKMVRRRLAFTLAAPVVALSLGGLVLLSLRKRHRR